MKGDIEVTCTVTVSQLMCTAVTDSVESSSIPDPVLNIEYNLIFW